jgi:formimidoylglutamate deiminase
LSTAGVGICFGSDSNVQIDLLEDARLLEYHLRMNKLERAVLPPTQLFTGATEIGASALAAPGGRLEAGRPADFVTLDLNDLSIAGADRESLLDHIVFSAERTAIRDVYVNGRQLIHDRHHSLEKEILKNFTAVQHRLWGAS